MEADTCSLACGIDRLLPADYFCPAVKGMPASEERVSANRME